MLSHLNKIVLSAALLACTSAFAGPSWDVPAMTEKTPAYNEYMEILANAESGNGGMNDEYVDFNNFNVSGRMVAIRDGLPENPYNILISVNGKVFYVDVLAHSILPDGNGIKYKIRRRHANNPEPGVFIRLDIERLNPQTRRIEPTQVWMKVATPEGRVLPVMKVLEGNYDL